MTTWFSSDTHFGHKNIQRFCPTRPGADFPSRSASEEAARVHFMNQAIVNNFNEVVGEGDELWILGDIAMGSFKESIAFVSQLNGNKKLVPGNHDRCWSGMSQKERDKNTQIYRDVGFEIMDEIVYMELGDHTVCVSHFPYEGDHVGEDRYPEHRPVDYGHSIIHGHVHDEWKLNFSKKHSPMINVGVDVWDYRPVNEQTLIDMLDSLANC